MINRGGLKLTTTPFWISLIIGLLGGLGSAILTQYIAGRREATARSYEHRREAYANFIIGFHRRWDMITEQEELGYPNSEPDDYLKPSYERLIPIQIFGTLEAADLAEKTMRAFQAGDIKSVNDTMERLLFQVRRDLPIPGHRMIRKNSTDKVKVNYQAVSEAPKEHRGNMLSNNRRHQDVQPETCAQVTTYKPRLHGTEYNLDAAFTPRSSVGALFV